MIVHSFFNVFSGIIPFKQDQTSVYRLTYFLYIFRFFTSNIIYKVHNQIKELEEKYYTVTNENRNTVNELERYKNMHRRDVEEKERTQILMTTLKNEGIQKETQLHTLSLENVTINAKMNEFERNTITLT